jgi:CHAT domain-containing protein
VSAVGGMKTLLAAADPEIYEAEKEVEGIAQLYSGRSKVILDTLIKESDVKAAGDYEIVHLSVHGKFNGQEPMLSYLKLAKNAQDDGQLTAAEMFGLPLGKTSLVVFSACETGKAQATYANEVLGMLRGLLYAGASTVVVSYWKVDSASTALWMETFHRAAQASSPAEAARQALRAVKKRSEYAHPYFWSAFMLVTK